MKMSTTISNSDFKDYIKNKYYYVDKTLLIEELFNKGDEVTLLPRPRRFGKTLNLSMLKYYFDISEDIKDLFKGLKIEKSNIFEKYLNKYPTIFLTFKDIKGNSYKEDYTKIKQVISDLYEKHEYLLTSNKLNERDKKYFSNILNEEEVDYSISLMRLSKYLYKYYDKKVVVLIDEYDTPVNKELDNEHYKNIINFLRDMISTTFKGNEYLFKGVITGILRIAKESMFSGANNILVRTILDNDFSNKFGFTEEEVLEILKYYDIKDKIEEVREWYNGYVFGNNIIYNPFSIVNYVKNKILDPYWVNSGNTQLIQNLLVNSDLFIKEDLEKLIKGKKIKAEIETSIIFNELDNSKYLWSLLLFSGYLKCTNIKENIYTLEIPNKEIKECYRSIMKMFLNKFIKNPLKIVYAIKEGNIELFKKELEWIIINISSSQDLISENSYHNLLIGLLAYLYDEYEVKSNRESGNGKYDLAIIPYDKKRLAYVIEIKFAKKEDKLEKLAEEGIKQIEEKKYVTELLSRGMKNILMLGIAFQGKNVYIVDKKL